MPPAGAALRSASPASRGNPPSSKVWMVLARAERFRIQGFPKIQGTLSGGPNNKDCSILGSILGPPILGTTT